MALIEYRREGKHPIPIDENNLKGIELIKSDLIDEDKLVRHSPKKLSREILKLI